MDFNDTHPEIQEGEFFLTNTEVDVFHTISWETKRKGDVAYTIRGEVISGVVPVFVQKKEFNDSRDSRV